MCNLVKILITTCKYRFKGKIPDELIVTTEAPVLIVDVDLRVGVNTFQVVLELGLV